MVPNPPDAVTGVKAVAATPTVRLVVGTVWVVVRVVDVTASEKVFDEV
jgi:hypothetical protein